MMECTFCQVLLSHNKKLLLNAEYQMFNVDDDDKAMSAEMMNDDDDDDDDGK